jgi:DNA-binding NarL/FixJ family response regulator
MVKRFIVAVPNEVQRRWLISLISRAYAETCVTSCDGARELVAASAVDADAHIVFALSLDDIDGIDVARILLGMMHADRLTVLLDRTDAFSLLTLEQYGLRRVLSQGESDDTIIGVLRGSVPGFVPLCERLSREPCVREQARLVRHLTPNFFQLMHLFSAGARDKDIARLTDRSLHTIRTQRKRIYAFWGVRSIAGLCMVMAMSGLIRFSRGRVIRPGVGGILAENVRTIDSDYS